MGMSEVRYGQPYTGRVETPRAKLQYSVAALRGDSITAGIRDVPPYTNSP